MAQMRPEARFRLNSPQVISETIEGEAIVVNLATGSYYSMPDSAAVLWEALVTGATTERIAAAVASTYRLEPDAATEAVTTFSQELQEEGLIVPSEDSEPQPQPQLELAVRGSAPFTPPQLEKFTDMQDLVLIDPVHEVDERGWPHAQPKG